MSLGLPLPKASTKEFLTLFTFFHKQWSLTVDSPLVKGKGALK